MCAICYRALSTLLAQYNTVVPEMSRQTSTSLALSTTTLF